MLPLPVKFTVRTRWATGWIFAAIMAGLGLGHLARNVLQARLALDGARRKGIDVAHALAKQLAVTVDPESNAKLTEAEGKLRVAIGLSVLQTPAEVEAAITKARAVLDQVVTALAARGAALHEQADRLLALTSISWAVPPGPDGEAARGEGGVRGRSAGLNVNDFKMAEGTLPSFAKGLAKRPVSRPGRGWGRW